MAQAWVASGGLELGRHVGELELGVLQLGERAAELAPLLDVGQRPLEAGPGGPERAGRDVDPAAVQAPHGDPEPLAFGTQAVRDGDGDLVEGDAAGRLRVPAELPLLLAEGDTGRVAR